MEPLGTGAIRTLTVPFSRRGQGEVVEEQGGGDQRTWEGARPLTVFSKSIDSQKFLRVSNIYC